MDYTKGETRAAPLQNNTVRQSGHWHRDMGITMPANHKLEKEENTQVSQRWDREYKKGKRYQNDPPIKFVNKIIKTLQKTQGISKGIGLYIGCGNGRNYIPLADSGLDILGIDISQVAIGQLLEKRPDFADRLQCIDFADFDSEETFDYIISIQVFQHGTERQTREYFQKSSALLKTGGLLFLRTNSASTDICLKHVVKETNADGGMTVCYAEGPKKNLDIHFYSQKELDKLCKEFDHVLPACEDAQKRVPPKTGQWSQWELVLRKNKRQVEMSKIKSGTGIRNDRGYIA